MPLQNANSLCDELVEQIKLIVAYSQHVNPAKLDYVPNLINDWERAKWDLRKEFLDGDLIKEFGTVVFELGEKEKAEKVQTFASNLYDNELLQSCMDFFDIEKFSEFIIANSTGFFDNIVQRDYQAPLGLIKAGTRISKAFKFFIPNTDICRYFQDVASEIIQQGSITGTLCLSVHPLDYLSMSENTYNWRSCHALDGCHRAGNLSYMLDNCTMVCYIRGDKPVKLPRFPSQVPWNNKKWRVLLYVSPNRELWFAGRQYPFASDYALNSLVHNMIMKTIAEDAYNYPMTKWHQVFSQVAIPQKSWSGRAWNNDNGDEFIEEGVEENLVSRSYDLNLFEEDHLLIQNTILPISAVVKDRMESMHYDDILNSDKYIPSYSYRKRGTLVWDTEDERYRSRNVPGFDEGYVIEMGAPTYCLCCGAPVMDEGDMLCGWCEAKYGARTSDIFECAICGQRTPYTATKRISELNDDFNFDEDELNYNSFHSVHVCEECYNERTVRCPICERRYAKNSPIINYKTPKKHDEVIGCDFDPCFLDYQARRKSLMFVDDNWSYLSEPPSFTANIDLTHEALEQLLNETTDSITL